jgi:hypothetical protein
MNPETLARLLWPHGDGADALQVYALLDGARDEAIAPAILQGRLAYECLYAGSLSRALQFAAPYLVHLSPASHLFSKMVNEGWGRAWGIFAIAQPAVTLKTLRKHFRTLLRVIDEQKQELVFRYYDPRVLRAYLPTCTGSELSLFFGPVHSFACENAAASDVVFHQRSELQFGSLSVTAQLPGEQMRPQPLPAVHT